MPNKARVLENIHVSFFCNLTLFIKNLASRAANTRKNKEYYQRELMGENELVQQLKDKKHQIIEVLLREKEECARLKQENHDLQIEVREKKVKF